MSKGAKHKKIAREISLTANVIRGFRTLLGDTQEEFARRLGVSVSTVAHYEINSNPSARAFRRMADIATEQKQMAFARSFLSLANPSLKQPESLAIMRLCFVFGLDAPQTQARSVALIDKLLNDALEESNQLLSEAEVKLLWLAGT